MARHRINGHASGLQGEFARLLGAPGDPKAERQWALFGVRARLAMLDAEREQLLAAYPELAPKTRRGPAPPEVLFVDDDDKDEDGSEATPARKRSPPELTGDAKRAAIEAIAKGEETAAEVAKRFGVSYQTVWAWVARTGRKLPTARGAQRRYSPQERAQMLAELRKGSTYDQVAGKFGVNKSTLQRWKQAAAR